MNNKSSVRLMTLLKLLSDTLEPAEQRLIERKVNQDAAAFAQLKRLRHMAGSATRGDLKLARSDSAKSDESLLRIAEFLDQTLTAKELNAFEDECWESPQLLHDVLVLFQSGIQTEHTTTDEPSVSDSKDDHLRNRLVELFPSTPPVAAKINGTSTSIVAKQLDNALRLDSRNESTERLPVVVPRSTSDKTYDSSRWSSSVISIFAISVLVATIALSIVVANWNRIGGPPTNVVESPNIESQLELDPTPEMVLIEDKNRDKDQPDSNEPEEIVHAPVPDEIPRNIDPEIPDTVDPELPKVRAPDGLVNVPESQKVPSTAPKDNPAIEATPRPAKLVWSWTRVEGLVAVREVGADVWSGALANFALDSDKSIDSDNPSNEFGNVARLDCKVLPLSWAQANLKGLGTWTFAENTDFTIAPTSSRNPERQSSIESDSEYRLKYSNGVRINLGSGRFAISDASIGTVIEIITTSGNWQIQIAESESIVVVESGSSSRVVMQKGNAIVNKTELKARQQLARTADGRLVQTINRETIKWPRKPENKFPSKQLSDQWLVSRDLFADMSQPDSISPNDRPLVRFAFATIDPPGQAALYLANVMPDVRAEGIHWLLAYANDPRRLRKVADELAAELGTPGMRTTLPRLVIAIQRRRLPPLADAESLVAGLQHRNSSVRRFSHGFLVHLYGSLEEYNSESDAVTRIRQARRWASAVNNFYRRVENARSQQR